MLQVKLHKFQLIVVDSEALVSVSKKKNGNSLVLLLDVALPQME